MTPLPDCFNSFCPPTLPSSDWVPYPNYYTFPLNADGFEDIDCEWSDMTRNSTISGYSFVPDRYEVPIHIEPPQNSFHRASSSDNHLVEARTSRNPTLEPNSSQNQEFPISSPVNITTASYSSGTGNEIGPQNIGNPSSLSDKVNRLIQRSRTGRTKLSHISREEIGRHFNIPIARAAKLMNVGLSAFKMRCRQFGITRWPQRKLRSIDSLISTVKELENINDERVREIIAVLEEKRKHILENPQVDMTDDLRKLRQMFFKMKFMKKRGKPRT